MLDACNQEEIELPILEVRDVKKVSLVLVTGDRGLCGSYNSQVIKAATKRINKLNEQGIDVGHRHFATLISAFLSFLFSSSFYTGSISACW